MPRPASFGKRSTTPSSNHKQRGKISAFITSYSIHIALNTATTRHEITRERIIHRIAYGYGILPSFLRREESWNP